MGFDFENLLNSADDILIKNPDNDTFVYLSKDVNLWLKESAASGRTLISPGGAARACGVSRQVIHNWYMRDRKLTAFLCRSEYSDSYVLVDLNEALKLAKQQ